MQPAMSYFSFRHIFVYFWRKKITLSSRFNDYTIMYIQNRLQFHQKSFNKSNEVKKKAKSMCECSCVKGFQSRSSYQMNVIVNDDQPV